MRQEQNCVRTRPSINARSAIRVSLLALCLVACGGDSDGGGNTVDAGGSTVDAGGSTVDAGGSSVDAASGADASPAACQADQDYGMATLADQYAEGAVMTSIYFDGALNADAAPDLLSFELRPMGVFASGIAAGTYTLEGAELDPATCGLCVLLVADVSDTREPGFYLATGGMVEITSVSPRLTGKATNLQFEREPFDGGTDPLMCTSAITEVAFDVDVMAKTPAPPDM